MAENKKPDAPDGAAEAPLDRVAYLRDVRRELLVKLGLPRDTKPEQVARLIQIKNNMDTIKNKK